MIVKVFTDTEGSTGVSVSIHSTCSRARIWSHPLQSRSKMAENYWNKMLSCCRYNIWYLVFAELAKQTSEMFVWTVRHDVKMEIKQETIDSPPEPLSKKYKWSFQSLKHSGRSSCWCAVICCILAGRGRRQNLALKNFLQIKKIGTRIYHFGVEFRW